MIGRIIEDSVAAESGLQVGDLILSADGIEFTDWMAWVDYVQDRAGQVMEILIERDGQTQLVTLTPASVIENEKIVGKIGVGVQIPEGFRESLMIEYSLPPVEALKAAFERTWYYSGATLKMIGYMFVGKASVENLSTDQYCPICREICRDGAGSIFKIFGHYQCQFRRT